MPNEVLDNPGSVNDFAIQKNSEPEEVFTEYTKALGDFRRQCIGETSIRTVTLEQPEKSITEEED